MDLEKIKNKINIINEIDFQIPNTDTNEQILQILGEKYKTNNLSEKSKILIITSNYSIVFSIYNYLLDFLSSNNFKNNLQERKEYIWYNMIYIIDISIIQDSIQQETLQTKIINDFELNEERIYLHIVHIDINNKSKNELKEKLGSLVNIETNFEYVFCNMLPFQSNRIIPDVQDIYVDFLCKIYENFIYNTFILYTLSLWHNEHYINPTKTKNIIYDKVNTMYNVSIIPVVVPNTYNLIYDNNHISSYNVIIHTSTLYELYMNNNIKKMINQQHILVNQQSNTNKIIQLPTAEIIKDICIYSHKINMFCTKTNMFYDLKNINLQVIPMEHIYLIYMFEKLNCNKTLSQFVYYNNIDKQYVETKLSKKIGCCNPIIYRKQNKIIMPTKITNQSFIDYNNLQNHKTQHFTGNITIIPRTQDPQLELYTISNNTQNNILHKLIFIPYNSTYIMLYDVNGYLNTDYMYLSFIEHSESDISLDTHNIYLFYLWFLSTPVCKCLYNTYNSHLLSMITQIPYITDIMDIYKYWDQEINKPYITFMKENIEIFTNYSRIQLLLTKFNSFVYEYLYNNSNLTIKINTEDIIYLDTYTFIHLAYTIQRNT